LHTDSFQLAHSTSGANKFFYGDVLAGIDLRITGTDRAPVVKGDLRILPGTDLSVILPGSQVKLIRSDGIVEFTTDLRAIDTAAVATDAERLRDSLRAQLPKIDLDLGVRINDRAVFAVVLDPTTGDAATFQGDGDLHFRYNSYGDMYLTGPFTIAQGGYTLEFYGLVKKRFDLGARQLGDVERRSTRGGHGHPCPIHLRERQLSPGGQRHRRAQRGGAQPLASAAAL